MHKFDAVPTQQVKKTHLRALEREQPHSHSPGAVPSLNSSGSESSGYKSLSPGSAEAFQEVFAHAEVIPSEQLPVLSECVEVRFSVQTSPVFPCVYRLSARLYRV